MRCTPGPENPKIVVLAFDAAAHTLGHINLIKCNRRHNEPKQDTHARTNTRQACTHRKTRTHSLTHRNKRTKARVRVALDNTKISRNIHAIGRKKTCPLDCTPEPNQKHTQQAHARARLSIKRPDTRTVRAGPHCHTARPRRARVFNLTKHFHTCTQHAAQRAGEPVVRFHMQLI